MSGSGGYYKYRYKFWLTYNCPKWVWVNNAPCAHCLADGRDDELPPKEDVRSIESSVRVSGRASRLIEGASSQAGFLEEDLARYCIEKVSLQNPNDNSSVALM
ncbi:uncharacterized protein LY89DRAFT_689786 [Mollisia scopiformis]|uniref:Uncharacterized protein n=1 Tax=Mollisia scopiformis TaxID=149040 RepID=A0A132BBV4_MOLSC|nr:uncharacterized protein LY89DRAFT_689786 [Mollisia scopiformis]KUJ09876.1 hypothetical protein LY89DRAFT_689786 [Mollisia scopiformis]